MSTAIHTHTDCTHHTDRDCRSGHGLQVIPLGMALGGFLAISFTLCVIFDLLFPGFAMYRTWMNLLPGFTWISTSSFLLGLAETFAYGWYIALLFVPLYNYFRSK